MFSSFTPERPLKIDIEVFLFHNFHYFTQMVFNEMINHCYLANFITFVLFVITADILLMVELLLS